MLAVDERTVINAFQQKKGRTKVTTRKARRSGLRLFGTSLNDFAFFQIQDLVDVLQVLQMVGNLCNRVALFNTRRPALQGYHKKKTAQTSEEAPTIIVVALFARLSSVV